MYFQIRDIEQVMQLKQNELGSLHERFGSQRHPPSMYIQVGFNISIILVSVFKNHKIQLILPLVRT